MLKFPKDIQYIFTDFDGVITDGYVFIPDNSDNFGKKINFKDVMGVYLSITNGYPVGIISGESCNAISYLQKTFNLTEIHTNIRKKLPLMQEIIERNNLDKNKIIYIGDDVNDVETMEFVGFPVAVNDAVKQVKNVKNIQITESNGGHGAFREVIDALIY